MTRFADIAIVGAGPAGARAGEFLSTLGAQVVLLDPKAPWEKPCGGGLTASAMERFPELRELGSDLRRVDRVFLEAAGAEGYAVQLRRPMWVVSRLSLGRWQLERAVRAGARHLRTRVRSVERSRDGWRLGTEEGSLAARLLVGADGAASLVRRVAAPRLRIELAPTRVILAGRGGASSGAVTVRLGNGWAGYVWDFPRPDHRSIGVGVLDHSLGRAAMDREIDLYRSSGGRCGCREDSRTGAVIGTAAADHGDFHGVAGRGFALLGDAAGLADPLTGEGIQNALRSADLLTEAWLGDGTFEAFPDLVRDALGRELATARLLLRLTSGSEGVVRSLGRGGDSRARKAAVATAVNAFNDQDARLGGMLVQWIKNWWRAGTGSDSRTTPAGVIQPCGCDRHPAVPGIEGCCASAGGA